MRGEKNKINKLIQHLLGSPPHARGKAAGLTVLSICFRITPACAGKRRAGEVLALASKDHLRMRGEK